MTKPGYKNAHVIMPEKLYKIIKVAALDQDITVSRYIIDAIEEKMRCESLKTLDDSTE